MDPRVEMEEERPEMGVVQRQESIEVGLSQEPDVDGIQRWVGVLVARVEVGSVVDVPRCSTGVLVLASEPLTRHGARSKDLEGRREAFEP